MRGRQMELLPVIDEGTRVLAAVSGGPDSVALLTALNDLRRNGKIGLCCAHLNHGIRGAESDGDEAFVRRLCERLGVRVYCEKIDVPTLAASRGQGLETCARNARREFLLRAMDILEADVIATAHHQDDQAETFLMHLLRGGGINGAAGIRARTGRFIRPLLGTTKDEILEFLASRNEMFRIDSTNAIADNPRNMLRLNVMPLLREVYPEAVRAISRFCDIARVENDYMYEKTSEWMGENAFVAPYGYIINACPDEAVARRVIVRLTGAGYDSAIRAVAAINKAETAQIPGYLVEASPGVARIIKDGFSPPLDEVALEDGAGIPGIGCVRIRPSDPRDISRDPFSQTLDAEALKGAVIRTRRPGDVMRPFGSAGSRKVKEILIDKKIPRRDRDILPMVAKGKNVMWIPGVLISHQASISEKTLKAVRLDWEREDIQPWRERR
ncbi:MAG: tRNA lysidine(34) synthetase TilS [Clostridia bacterium]|nr:tRNA lysidine(34) synthetase TilS [Clostridia bacterium]